MTTSLNASTSFAVAVDDGRAALRRPQLDLARPVRLHDVRDDDQQRVGVGHGGGQQGLRGLAEAWLVGQEERAVAFFHLGDQSSLVPHEVEAARRFQAGGFRQLHRRRSAAGTVLEGAEERIEQLPVVEPATLPRLRPRRTEVRGEERVGHLRVAHRQRHHLALHGRRRPARVPW